MSIIRGWMRQGNGLALGLAILVTLVACGGGGGGGSGGTPPSADLEVVTFIPLVSGTTVTYQVLIRNSGNADAASFQVDLYYDGAVAPSVGAAGDESRIVASLAASGTQSLTFVRAATPPGSYSSWLQVDTLDAVSETNEGDNVSGPASVTVTTPPGPDLVVSSFTAIVAGSDVTYNVDVTNLGGSVANAFDVDLYYDLGTPPLPAAPGNDTQMIPSLGSGATQNLVFTRLGAPDGTYTSWAQVDTNDGVAESDEGNNVGGPEPVFVGQPLADLLITSFTSNVNGTAVNYSLEVTNAGPLAAGPFDMDVYLDSPIPPVPGVSGDSTASVGSLAPGASQIVAFGFINQAPGTLNSWAQVDTLDTVVEGDETNNVAGPEVVTVSAAADLVITGFSSVVNGSTVDYTVNVRNQGGTDAGAFSVDLYYHLPIAPSGGAPGDDASVVTSLTAGANTSLGFSRTATPVGTYNSWAQVDTADAVPESDEGNNVGGPEPVIVAGMADLVIMNLSSSVNGSDVTWTADIMNQGTAAAGAFDVDLYYDRATPPPPGLAGEDSTPVGALGIGASTPVLFTRLSVPVGSYDSWLQVDTNTSVAESDELNNVIGPETINVGLSGPDLVITLFSSAVVGNDVTYNVEVTNQGGTDAGGFAVDIYWNQPGAPTPPVTGDQLQFIPSLAAGMSNSFSLTRTGTPVGTYNSWVLADTFDGIAETDENNNVAGPEVVTVP